MTNQQRRNRIASLKEKFNDRYFNILEAAEFLNITPNGASSVLDSYLKQNYVCRTRDGRKGYIYKFVPEGYNAGLTAAAQESAKLQQELTVKTADDGTKSIPIQFIKTPNQPTLKDYVTLPSILEVNSVKYVRMDRIAEVLLEHI